MCAKIIPKNFLRRLTCFAFVMLFTLCGTALSPLEVHALSEDEISAPSAVLMEPTTGEILFEKNPHDIRPCASITKVMTLILVFEAIDANKFTYDDMAVASAHAASMGGSDIWLEEGESMSVHDLIKSVVVASANDSAVVLAELVSGTEDEFVAKMNEKAKTLGMNDTTFKNCNGLDEEGHLTSAYDVALMSAELMKHEKIFEYSSIWLDNLRGGATQIVNTNKLLKTYKGITGLKTGTTSGAGSCMSATATRDNLSLVAVVLGCDTGTGRFKDAATLLDYGFANYKVETLTVPGEYLVPISVKGGMENEVSVSCEPSLNVLLPKGSTEELECKANLPKELTAPVEKGVKIGTITYLNQGATVDELEVFTASESHKMSFGEIFAVLLSKIISL